MLDHDAYSLEDIARAFAGQPVDNLTRDEVLDNITMTWVTNTGVSSGRLYAENTLGFFDVKDVKVPAAVSVFPRELYQAPRSWTEQAYPKLIYFNEVEAGNHFAAWQEPELFAEELAGGFRSAPHGTDRPEPPCVCRCRRGSRDVSFAPSAGRRRARPAGRGAAAPSFDGATGWLNSEPLTPEGLRGRVVLVDFWTYTCVNWLRTLPYVRAWATKYADAA